MAASILFDSGLAFRSSSEGKNCLRKFVMNENVFVSQVFLGFVRNHFDVAMFS